MKKSLIVLAVTAIMIFAMSITSMAAGTKVTGLKQTVGNESSVKIQWNAVPEAYGYYIYLSKDGGKTYARQYNTTSPDVTQAEGGFYSLQAGQKYYVKVAAVYRDANYNYTVAPLSDPISVVTAPKRVDYTTIKQTKATTSSVSFKWTYSAGASGYVVAAGDKVVTVSGTSATVKMKAGSYSSAKVQAYKQSNEGFKAYAYASTFSYLYAAPTTPKYVASGKAGNLTWYPTESNKVKVAWNMVNGYSSTTDGYQVQIYSINGKKRLKSYTIKDKYTMSKEFNIKSVKNTGFKVRVRAYKKINGKNFYGKWSKFKAVVPEAAVKFNTRVSRTSIRATWSKIKNVSKYYVYVCKNTNVYPKSDQVWKKVATLSKNATSYTAKNLKVGNYNGIYVIPVVKVGGKTYKAEATWYKEAYLSSYYY